MRYAKALLVALVVLCAVPGMAADVVPAAGGSPVAAVQPAGVQAQAAQAPAPVRLEDLLAPQPVLKGQQGPCTIYTQCRCTWGTIRISCSGRIYCSAGLECDDVFYTCAMACNS
jgi:hypothetical protein